LYISFFPQLIAGPIVRYSTFQKQINERKESIDKLSVGICRFIVGLGKKVIIANQMAIVTDRIYELQAMGGLAISAAWIGAIAYTFQIFFDFSGYSDMATGLALMFGFKFEKNFNYPYIAKSISEFWRRWHISLSTWFRDYVYFPLGGSRVENKDIVIRNLAIVWMLTGIWHGANWTFFLWGLLNMLFIVAEKIVDFEKQNINNKIKHVYMLVVVCIGWVIFRSDSLAVSGSYIGNMFNIIKYPIVDSYSYMFIKEYFVFFIAAIAFSMPIAAKVNEWFMKGIPLRKVVQTKKPYDTSELSVEPPLAGLFNVGYPIVMMGLLMICVTYLIKGNYNPFIYFKF
ncbi:MAG: MBOAT family protein, partial [Velocimicrobium sp.]